MLQTAQTAHTVQTAPTDQMKEDFRKALKARVAAAETELAAAEADLKAFNTLFPETAATPPKEAKAPGKPAAAPVVGKPASGGKPASNGKVTSATSKKGGGTVFIGRLPKAKTGENATVPERCAAVMGKRVYTAGDLTDELVQQGEKFKSNNLHNYVSTTLNSAMMTVPAPDGSELLNNAGKAVKVHRFTAVERGQYRVSTIDDVQNELKSILGASEVVVAESQAAVDQHYAESAERTALAVAQH